MPQTLKRFKTMSCAVNEGAMITGVNHITLAVTDLDRSVAFYQTVFDAKVKHLSVKNSYLEIGPLWLCLERRDTVHPRIDDTHIAFTCPNLEQVEDQIKQHAQIWKTNKSEGRSLYIIGPDGHKLELHIGDLNTRLSHMNKQEHA